MSIIVLTACNRRTPTLDVLETSLLKHGYTYKVIGLGERWTGFVFKLQQYSRALHEINDNAQLVATVDAYDVIFAGGPRELIDKYSTCPRPIVVGVEPVCRRKTCTPVDAYYEMYGRPHTSRKYINSGVIIGTAGAMRDMFDAALASPYSSDDQKAIGWVVSQHPEWFTLDTQCNMIGTVTGIPTSFRLDSPTERIRYTVNGTYPTVIHTPGNWLDMHARYTRIGKQLLGREFVGTPVLERVMSFIRQRSTITISLVAIVVIVALCK